MRGWLAKDKCIGGQREAEGGKMTHAVTRSVTELQSARRQNWRVVRHCATRIRQVRFARLACVGRMTRAGMSFLSAEMELVIMSLKAEDLDSRVLDAVGTNGEGGAANCVRACS